MEYVVQEPAKRKNSSWVVILFFITLGVLTFNYVLKFFIPQGVSEQNLLKSNYDNSTTSFNKLEFTNLLPQLPEKLPIAKINKITVSTAQLEQRLLQTYELKQLPQIDTIWQGPLYSLTKIPDPLTYVLIRKVEPAQPPTTIVISEALAVAEKTVKTLFPDEEMQAISQTAQPYTVWIHPHPEPASAADANALQISFGYQFGPYPVFYAKDYTYPVTLIITGDGLVGKITAQPFVVTYSEDRVFKTVSLAEALKAIEGGNGSIIYQSYKGSGTPSLATIVSGEFTSVSVEYRADDTSELLIPYYRFKGRLTNTENIDFEAEVITPAIPITR